MRGFTYDVVKPQVFTIVFTTFIPGVIKNSLDLIFLFVLNLWIDIVGGVCLIIIKLAKVLHVVEIVWDLATSAGHTDFIP
jgi:hypothetical protein